MQANTDLKFKLSRRKKQGCSPFSSVGATVGENKARGGGQPSLRRTRTAAHQLHSLWQAALLLSRFFLSRSSAVCQFRLKTSCFLVYTAPNKRGLQSLFKCLEILQPLHNNPGDHKFAFEMLYYVVREMWSDLTKALNQKTQIPFNFSCD